MSTPIKLYNFPKSCHAHRIELMLSLLNLPSELVFVDLAKGAHKQPDYLAKAGLANVPMLEMDDGTTAHLAAGDTVVQRGTAHRWLNRGAEPCVILFVMAQATPVQGVPYLEPLV